MFRYLFIVFLALFFLQSNLNAQDEAKEKVYYSEIEHDLKSLNYELYSFIKRKKIDTVKTDNLVFNFIRDTINKTLTNVYMDDFSFVGANNDIIEISKIDKPIFLMVASIDNANNGSCCRDKFYYLNIMADKFKGSICFIILLNDSSEVIKTNKNLFSENLILIPSNKPFHTKTSFSKFNHRLGIPYIYLIDKDKKIFNVDSSIMGETENAKDIDGNKMIITRQKAIEINTVNIESKLLELIKE